MTLERVICTTCGNSLEAYIDQSAITCDACGNTFLATNGITLAGKSEQDIGSIRKLRNNLKRAIVADDHKNILHFSKEILRLIPKDAVANYYYAYANYSFGSRRYLFDFYDNTLEINEEVNQIIDHIIEYSDVRDKSLIETFIARNNPNRLERYRERYDQKLIEEENYSSIPRDVFISFRSTEIEVAQRVLDELENDGNSCWISSRNLRPNDNDNYWANIEDAINKCKVFLVISSNDAMISRDVKKELDFASKKKKKRLEFKIDNARHTSLFKYFFDGCKWIDGRDDFVGALQELRARVYDIINDFETPTIAVKKESIDDNAEFLRKINRSKIDLMSGNYEDASNTIKDALGIDPENPDAWWLLFLAENQFASTDAFLTFLKKSDLTLSKLSEVYSKVSFRQYKMYISQSEDSLPRHVIDFEHRIYEAILDYINKNKLPAHNKKDYLSSYFPNHILTAWSAFLYKFDFKSDEIINERIDDEYQIKTLENLFDDFEEIESHPQYSSSHIKKYYERFMENYKLTLEQRKKNLEEIQAGIERIYDRIELLLEDEEYEDALTKSLELFYFDNSSVDKYYYVLLSKLRAKSSIEMYDRFRRLGKKKKTELMNSILFERLFKSERYNHLLNDILVHTYYKKKKKDNRVYIPLRGDEDGV